MNMNNCKQDECIPKPNARVIAFYLPQFHPIPENDEWWGKGFTEWTNTAKAKPMFPGHYQPHIPADLGFYDLRVPETREAQAQMAREHGVEAFCYYHYWFAGKRILERPFNEVLRCGKPDFPFCLCWANQSWTGIWHGCPERMLIEQTYPGEEDHRAHFAVLEPAFADKRYLKVDGRPVFLIYNPKSVPNLREVTKLWRELARKSELGGLFLIGVAIGNEEFEPSEYGFDASIRQVIERQVNTRTALWRKVINQMSEILAKNRKMPRVYSYQSSIPEIVPERCTGNEEYLCLVPNWDNTPRSGVNGIVLHHSTPELFRLAFRKAVKSMQKVPMDRRLIFVKSWNEWAEGNHLEPDLKFGRQYLQVLREETSNGMLP